MCRKNGYSLREAKTVLNEVKRNRGKQYRKEIRYYKCDKEECKGLYHLTSKSDYEIAIPINYHTSFYYKEWLKLISN